MIDAEMEMELFLLYKPILQPRPARELILTSDSSGDVCKRLYVGLSEIAYCLVHNV